MALNFWLGELFILQYVREITQDYGSFTNLGVKITTNLEDLYYPISRLTIKAAANICAILVSAYVGGSLNPNSLKVDQNTNIQLI